MFKGWERFEWRLEQVWGCNIRRWLSPLYCYWQYDNSQGVYYWIWFWVWSRHASATVNDHAAIVQDDPGPRHVQTVTGVEVPAREGRWGCIWSAPWTQLQVLDFTALNSTMVIKQWTDETSGGLLAYCSSSWVRRTRWFRLGYLPRHNIRTFDACVHSLSVISPAGLAVGLQVPMLLKHGSWNKIVKFNPKLYSLYYGPPDKSGHHCLEMLHMHMWE